MSMQKKDFVEIEFTGKVKGGEVFDSNIKEDLKQANLDFESKPLVFCLGEGMFLKSIDDFLIGKPESPATYELDLKPEDAFGKRVPSLVQMIPLKVFIQHKANPVPGAMFNFDGRIGKTLTVSGGRVMVDFNSPLAGKDVHYKINLKRKVTDLKEKVKALNEFLFRKDIDFTVEGNKIILRPDKDMKRFVGLFKDKYKEMLGIDTEVREDEEAAEHEKARGEAESEEKAK